MTTHGIERHRNYGTVLERHERDKKLRRVQRAFTYFLIFLALILILWWITSMEMGNRASDRSPAANNVKMAIILTSYP